MATQPAVKTAPIRNAAGGRMPPGTARKAGASRAFDYARSRLELTRPEDFAAYVAGYPAKAGLQLYMYRLKPKIDFGLIGVKEHTIRKVFEVGDMNLDYVRREFGRGKYQFKLNDKMRDKGQTEVCTMIFDVIDPELEPVYDVRTLCLGAPENIDEINRLIEKGVLMRDANNMPRLRTERDGPAQTQGAAVASAPSNDLISRDVIGQVFLKLISQGTQNPSDMMNQAISIAKLLRPETPMGAGGLTVEQVLEIVDKRLGNGRAVDDPFSAWERIEGFLAKARGGVAAVAGAATSDNTLAGISDVLKSAAVVIPQVIQGIDFLQKQRMRLAVTVNANGAVSPPNGPQLDHNGNVPQPMSLAEQIGEVCQLGFVKMNEGVPGFDFASYVCQFHPGGLDIFRWLEARGTTGVMGLLVMNPEAAPILADAQQHAKLEKFLDDFFTYDPDGGAGEDDDETPLDGASAA